MPEDRRQPCKMTRQFAYGGLARLLRQSLCLTVTAAIGLAACQAPGTSPNGSVGTSGNSPIGIRVAASVSEYARLADEAQRALIRSSIQGVLSSPALLVPRPSASPGVNDSAAAARLVAESRLMELLKGLMSDLANRFAAIIPPPQYAARHAELVAFFKLNAELFSETLANPGPAQSPSQTLTQRLSAVLAKRGLSETSFREQGKRAGTLLSELQREGLRAELATVAKGPGLDEQTYDQRQSRLQAELEADLGNSGGLLLAAASRESLDTLRTRVRSNAAAVAALNPPASRSERQLDLYGLAKAGRELIETLYTVVEKQEFPATPNPFLLLDADMVVALSRWSQAKKALTGEPDED